MTEWIVSSAVLIVVIALVRQLLKGRISLQLQYALWAIVLVRLLVPVSFGQTKISVQNVVQAGQTVQTEQGEPAETPGITIDIPPSRVDYVGPDLAATVTQSVDAEGNVVWEEDWEQWEADMDADWEEYKAENTRHVTLSVTDILYLVWIAGMAVTAVIFVVSNLRFRLRLRRSRRPLEAVSRLPVYLTGAVETPCLFGLFRPAVYVTPEVAEDEVALGHVLAHEGTHCRHGDHIWALLRCLCLVIHWYNPLVWLAAALSRRDAELACDAGAIRRIGEEERSAYGRTLIGLTCAHRSNLLHTATTMTGSKKSIKERIVLIAKKPKMAVYTLIAVILIAAVAVGCTFTGAARTPEEGFLTWVKELKGEDFGLTLRAATSKGDLNQNQYARLYAILGTIEKDDFSELPAEEDPDQIIAVSTDPFLYIKGIAEESTKGEWDFYCIGDGTIAVSANYDVAKEYGFDEWRLLDCPELYDFITELSGDDSAEPPAFVQATAEFQMELRRANVEQEYLMIGMTHEVLAELKGLTRLELGTAGLDWAVEMWKMDYDITVAAGQEAYTTANTLWLVVQYDYTTEKYTRFLGSMDEKTLNYTYNTPEMIDKYGDMYRAAAMELYGQYAEASKQLDTPPAPSSGLYNLIKRGDTVSLTLHTREGGEQRTFVLDYQSDAWRKTNQLTGVSWNLLDQAPEGTWDYWLTYTSEDGTVSVTFYAGENGPVCYVDEQRTIWWTERGGTPDAETLREEVYDVCVAEQGMPGEVPDEEPTDPAAALRALANGSDALTMTLFDREWMHTRSLSLAVSSTGDYADFLNLLMDESWVEVELSATPADYRVTLLSPDNTKTLTFYSGSQGLVEYTCGDVSIMWMSANGTWDGDSQYASEIRKIYQFWEYFPNQIFVRAVNPEAAATAYVTAHEDMYRNMSPGNYHSVTDYETLDWGIEEVSADGTMVQGWLRYALVPAMGANYFMEGGAEFGTGEYEGWVINGMGFRLALQPDGYWDCTGWGGGMLSLEYYGYEVREPYSVPWDVPVEEPAPTYEEYFSQLVDYGYDWHANYDSDIELKVSSGSNLGGCELEYEEPYLYVREHELYGGERLWMVTAMENLKVMYCGPDWFYALVDGKTLIRMDYWGINYEVLFHDETGLIDQNREYSFKLADGKVMYFLAGTEDGGAAIYRLYLPEKRVDAVYEYTADEVKKFTFATYGDQGIQPVECQIYGGYPVSNHEVTWTVYNPEFWELYGQLLEDSEAYEKYFASFPGESISSVFQIARDYKIYPYTEHYHNTLTGEHDTIERIGYSEGAPTRWWLE